MKQPKDFEFNIGFDEDAEDYYVVFATIEESDRDDSQVWKELKRIVLSGFYATADESVYSFGMEPAVAVESLRRNGFIHNLDLI
jgi:hypothetical protein